MNLFNLLCFFAYLSSTVWTKNAPNCGRHNHNSEVILGIINGTDASEKPREFPWVAQLVGITSELKEKACGATILNKRWILTAAHCVHEHLFGPQIDAELFGFFGGIHFRDTGLDREHVVTRTIEKIVSHPHFKATNATILNDIALLKLSADLDLSLPQLAPICLPHKEDLDKRTDIVCTAVGWGTIDFPTQVNGHFPRVLQKSSSKIWKQSKCKTYLRAKGVPKVADSQLCWGGHGQTSVCSGDSGGPLLCQTKIDGHLVWTQYGIISHGRGKKIPRGGEMCEMTVMTRVSEFSEWIWKTID